MLTVGSLFAGIGGIDLGLERAGMQVRWQVEIEDYCRRVLAKHWPEVTRYADIRDVGAHNLEPVDLIAGGFPCQPHSLAGKRRASEDERDLWGEFARIIREVRPRWVLAENVPGLLSSEAGRYLGRVLRDLAESGYDAEWDCIPAAAFGAPHRRYRLFIVAYTASVRRDEGTPPRRVFDPRIRPQTQRNSWRGHLARGARGRIRYLPDRGIHGMAHGIPHRVDRLEALGNAVVPQVAQWLGERILEAERDSHSAR